MTPRCCKPFLDPCIKKEKINKNNKIQKKSINQNNNNNNNNNNNIAVKKGCESAQKSAKK
jgi:hypothetical protein